MVNWSTDFCWYAETRSFGFFDYLMKLVDITIIAGMNGKRSTRKKTLFIIRVEKALI